MESQVSSMRRPCFREDDDGLASIAGFSGVNHGYPINNINNLNQPFVCYNNNTTNNNGNIMMRRRNSLRNITSLSSSLSSSSTSNNVFSPRSNRLFDEIHSPHFLEACALCNKPLGGNRDIFMYRGDTPFCSEECREEQIEIDEAKEKNRNYKALRSKKESKKKSSNTSTNSSSSSPSKTQNYPFRTGTVVAA